MPQWLLMCGLLLSAAHVAAGAEPQESPLKPLRIGLIGLDTSHVVSFTQALADPARTADLASVQVTAAWPGGSPTFPLSRDRVAGFTDQVRSMGVEIVDSIPKLLERVDGVILHSVDGRQHLEQALPVFQAGKRLFIDKPVAASLVDAIAIDELSRRYKTPWFSSSTKRYAPEMAAFAEDKIGTAMGCDAYGNSESVPHVGDMFWYGIHGVEIVYAVLGPGCAEVTAWRTPLAFHAAGRWKDGRVGTYRGIPAGGGKQAFGATVIGASGIATAGVGSDKTGLLREMARFFQTGQPPLAPETTLELIAFLEAAEESQRKGGGPVSLQALMEKSRA